MLKFKNEDFAAICDQIWRCFDDFSVCFVQMLVFLLAVFLDEGVAAGIVYVVYQLA